MSQLVIVGASLAGLRAAQGARSGGWEGEIVIVGEEVHMPYSRPPLSKELLTGAIQSTSDHLLPVDVEATWLLGERAIAVNREARRIALADGEEVPYDRLVIATGSRPRRWRGEGAGLAGLHMLRKVEDALAVRDALGAAEQLAIVGAGFLGCEIAASARKRGVPVTMIELAATPMPILGSLLGERCASLHRFHGVDLRLNTSVKSIHGEQGRVAAVELADGQRIDADVVIIALGAVPCVDWLAGSGLSSEAGVLCDATLTALADPDVLAAGDVARWPCPLAPDPIRVEHWANAAEQGVLAGQNSVLPATERDTYRGVPSFWSNQYEVKLQAVGLPWLARRIDISEESEDGSRLVAMASRGGRLVAAIGVNAARRLPSYRRWLGRSLDGDSMRELAVDPNALGLPSLSLN